ncbi:TPA: hypothetical protein ACYSBI_001832 [Morganella morganii]|uniref:hypothetical protein n=1 Tax=Morganella morganii TaxID=582 RepID=UPI0032DABBE8
MPNNKKTEWQQIQLQLDENYKEKLSILDPNRIGISIKCPECSALSWLKLPETRTGFDSEIFLACPSACGYGGLINTFSPVACKRDDAGDYDVDTICKQYKTPYAFNGYVHRCPVCYIENPRDVMKSMVNKVETAVKDNQSRDKLIQLLSDVVSTFDGVMRRCYEIHMVNENIKNYKNLSFQNITLVKDSIAHLIQIDMIVDDWDMFVRIFQKRHLFIHSLGVVDQKYIDKTGDTTVPIGKQISLSSEEVLFLAKNTSKIVMMFFGLHLS